MRTPTQALSIFLSLTAAFTPVYGQALQTAQPPGTALPQQRRAPVQPEVTGGAENVQVTNFVANYVLGPGDQVQLRVTPDAEDLSGRTFRVDSDGTITLPLAGSVRAAGLTPEQLETAITGKLSAYIRSPQVAVMVTHFRTDPVLVTGMFARPGIYPLQATSRKLLEVLSSLGGLQPNASRRVRITRRLENGMLPLPGAVVDESGKVSTAEISLTRLMETTNPVENIELAPYDVLYAGKAEMVFVNLDGVKAGAFPLDERDYLSVVQLISMAGGMPPGLNAEKARVLRPILNTSRRAEIPLNVKAILEGKQNDYPLMPNDLLMVPRAKSTVRSTFSQPLTVAVPALVTGLVWIAIRR